MFGSPCSLRSTQCAVLIALAAAAGIVRVEQTPARAEAQPRPAPSASSLRLEPVSRRAAVHVEAAIEAFAPWLKLLGMVAPLQAAAAAETLSEGRRPDAAAVTVVLREDFVPCPAARAHAFPYAVGPPRVAITLPLRAGDTRVSGDFTACRLSVPGIAPFLTGFHASTGRDGAAAEVRASPSSELIFALRGENAPTAAARVTAAATLRTAVAESPLFTC